MNDATQFLGSDHCVAAFASRLRNVTEKVAADIEVARNWKPGSLKDDGRRAGSERGFRL